MRGCFHFVIRFWFYPAGIIIDHPANSLSSAEANFLKFPTFNTSLHSGAYLGMPLSPCHGLIRFY
jgi:hypothetical protein